VRVTEERLDAYAFCQALLPVEGTRSRRRCAGYEPVPAVVIKATKTMFFGDFSGGAGATDVDALMVEMPSHDTYTLRFADDADRLCPHCGQWTRTPMLEPAHPVYDHLSDQDPDRLLEMDEASRRAAAAASDQADSLQQLVLTMREQGERQAAAYQAQAEENRALMEQNAALMERLLGGNGANGDEAEKPEPAPATRRRKT
jgi:hypothetical protein